jgi:hypothetical protein
MVPIIVLGTTLRAAGPTKDDRTMLADPGMTLVDPLTMAPATFLPGELPTEQFQTTVPATKTILTWIAVPEAELLPEHRLCTRTTAFPTLTVVRITSVI